MIATNKFNMPTKISLMPIVLNIEIGSRKTVTVEHVLQKYNGNCFDNCSYFIWRRDIAYLDV